MNTDTRQRLELALADARELVELRRADILRCLEQGLAWSHETVRTARARLAAAIADVELLELIVRPPTKPAVHSSAAIPPLTVRR